MYVELHVRSAFSFLEGASLPELLMARAAQLEMPAMALLDRNGLYGAPRFHIAAQRAGTRAHIGAEVAVRDTGERGHGRHLTGCHTAFRQSPCALPCWLNPASAIKISAA